MDARTTMIVAKGKPITSNVVNCAYRTPFLKVGAGLLP